MVIPAAARTEKKAAFRLAAWGVLEGRAGTGSVCVAVGSMAEMLQVRATERMRQKRELSVSWRERDQQRQACSRSRWRRQSRRSG